MFRLIPFFTLFLIAGISGQLSTEDAREGKCLSDLELQSHIYSGESELSKVIKPIYHYKYILLKKGTSKS